MTDIHPCQIPDYTDTNVLFVLASILDENLEV